MTNYNFEGLLNKQVVKRVFNMFNHGSKEVRLVGGCVRDAFLSIKSNDLDFAANFEPKEIINILGKNDILYEDFAYQYGSILAYINDIKIQITSLREDTNQIGRHTNIIYTEDWKKDSARRDFSINALYLSNDGEIFDYFDGRKDIEKKQIRYIGDIEKRIQEDYLRIFRYYRFLGLFESPNVQKEYDKIHKKYIFDSFNYLSNDLVRREILKMFKTEYSLNCFFINVEKNIKREWVDIVNDHFSKSNYEIGINKCLNKIDFLI
tara:strand:- start:110 stop:901 length:792 start_codon:yes stop_codon:yes gene_type:complete